MNISKLSGICKGLCWLVGSMLVLVVVVAWFNSSTALQHSRQNLVAASYKKQAPIAGKVSWGVPHIEDKFPWGADFSKLDRLYRHLSRSWAGLSDFERSRIEQYITDVSCGKGRMPQDKIRVYFRLKSHRLYEVQFEYIGACIGKYRNVLSRLQRVYGSPSATHTSMPPKGSLFVSRSITDAVWALKSQDINLRHRVDVFKRPVLGKSRSESLFVTFRAHEDVLARKRGPAGERPSEQLINDTQIAAGGDVVSVLFLGEISPDKQHIETLAASGRVKDVFAGVSKLCSSSSIPVAALMKPMGPYDEAVGAELITALSSVGMSVVFMSQTITSGNSSSRNSTIRILESANIKPVVPGGDYTIVNTHGHRFAFVAFSLVDDSLSMGKLLRMVQGNVALLAGKFDAVIVGIEWSSAEPYCAPERVRRVAETALAAGAYVVWGYGNSALCGMMKFNKGAAFFGSGVLFGKKHRHDPESVAMRVRLNSSGLIDYQLHPFVANPYPKLVSGRHLDHIIMRFRLLSQNCIRTGPPNGAKEPFNKPKR